MFSCVYNDQVGFWFHLVKVQPSERCVKGL
jgi:hypothetical protein